jgi:hypothetical protein
LYRLNDCEKDSQNCVDVVEDDRDTGTTNEKLRQIELEFNNVWEAYKNLYYGLESVGSVYVTSGEGNTSNFEGCFCIQKLSVDVGASWNSISFVHAHEVNDCEYEYVVDTTIHVVLNPVLAHNSTQQESTSGTDYVALGTTMSKKSCKTCNVQSDKEDIHKSHIEHIGTMIEANETELRSNLERNVIPKHQETLIATQKKQTSRPQVNPLMGMMMNSDMLKKRLAKSNLDS